MYDHILLTRELTQGEKENLMYIFGKIIMHDNPVRKFYSYYIKSNEVCKAAFLLTYDIGERVLKSLLKHFVQNGPVPRKHGNSTRTPHNAVTYDDAQRVVKFICNYAEEFDLSMAAPLRGRDALSPTSLPVSLTKKELHRAYNESCTETEVKAVSRPTFVDIWKSCVLHIQISTPKTECLL